MIDAMEIIYFGVNKPVRLVLQDAVSLQVRHLNGSMIISQLIILLNL